MLLHDYVNLVQDFVSQVICDYAIGVFDKKFLLWSW
jgi:hypothetical protein